MAETLLANIQVIEFGEIKYAAVTRELENHHVHTVVQSQRVILACQDLACRYSYRITTQVHPRSVMYLYL